MLRFGAKIFDLRAICIFGAKISDLHSICSILELKSLISHAIRSVFELKSFISHAMQHFGGEVTNLGIENQKLHADCSILVFTNCRVVFNDAWIVFNDIFIVFSDLSMVSKILYCFFEGS